MAQLPPNFVPFVRCIPAKKTKKAQTQNTALENGSKAASQESSTSTLDASSTATLPSDNQQAEKLTGQMNGNADFMTTHFNKAPGTSESGDSSKTSCNQIMKKSDSTIEEVADNVAKGLIKDLDKGDAPAISNENIAKDGSETSASNTDANVADEKKNEEDEGNYITIFESRLQKAAYWREEGNTAYKQGEYYEAMKKYRGALIFLRGIDQHITGEIPIKDKLKGIQDGTYPTEDEIGRMKEMKITVYCNMAVAHFKEPPGEYDKWMIPYHKIIKYCDEVLELQSTNTKALFYKAKALFGQGELDASLKEAKKAAGFDVAPDPKVLKLIKEIEEAIRNYDKDLSGTYFGMFNRLSALIEKEEKAKSYYDQLTEASDVTDVISLDQEMKNEL